jgi:hypothetical protein
MLGGTKRTKEKPWQTPELETAHFIAALSQGKKRTLAIITTNTKTKSPPPANITREKYI